ncbi:MAG: hypothetical protein K0S25_918 [Bacillus sp. (in: firmicutes)]|nr:hypothetical protein [Bacillus sp. (in: firmicutes)]
MSFKEIEIVELKRYCYYYMILTKGISRTYARQIFPVLSVNRPIFVVCHMFSFYFVGYSGKYSIIFVHNEKTPEKISGVHDLER